MMANAQRMIQERKAQLSIHTPTISPGSLGSLVSCGSLFFFSNFLLSHYKYLPREKHWFQI